jgi:hypothetical protein
MAAIPKLPTHTDKNALVILERMDNFLVDIMFHLIIEIPCIHINLLSRANFVCREQETSFLQQGERKPSNYRGLY